MIFKERFFGFSLLFVLYLNFSAHVKADVGESFDSQKILSDPLLQQFLKDIREPSPIPADQIRAEDTLVTIQNGTIQGIRSTAGIGAFVKRIYAYKKIPYAEPPVGHLRFQNPRPPIGWGDEILDGTLPAPACAQYLTSISPNSEDCLFVNVFTPVAANETHLHPPLPVMVFIHGGAFIFGEASYYHTPKLLASPLDVVYVVIQYRLGALGFLSTGDSVARGNYGMKDQVQALRWVKENIGPFGGDPSKVTIFGESAGAASSLYHLISPLSQGLFSRLIAMSGSPITEWSIDRNPWESAQKLGQGLNCSTSSSSALLNCLRSLEYIDIQKQVAEDTIRHVSTMKITLPGISPVIEGQIPGAFLTQDPLQLLTKGPLPDVEIIVGSVQQEGTLPVSGWYFFNLEPTGKINDTNYLRDRMVGDFLSTFGANDAQNGGSLSSAVALTYLEGDRRQNFTEMTYKLVDMMTAMFMKAPILRTADILSRRLPGKVWLYSFEHHGRNSLYHLLYAAVIAIVGGEIPPMKPGIMHADDLIYMFPLPFVMSADDIAFTRLYCEMWTNFATFGNPTPEATDKYPIWPSYSVQNSYYLKLNGTPTVYTDWPSTWRQGHPNP